MDEFIADNVNNISVCHLDNASGQGVPWDVPPPEKRRRPTGETINVKEKICVADDMTDEKWIFDLPYTLAGGRKHGGDDPDSDTAAELECPACLLEIAIIISDTG